MTLTATQKSIILTPCPYDPIRYMTLTATQKSSVAGEKLIRTTKDTHIVLRAMREKLDNASAEVPTTRHT